MSWGHVFQQQIIKLAIAASTRVNMMTPRVSPQGKSAWIIVLIATPNVLFQPPRNFIHDGVLSCTFKEERSMCAPKYRSVLGKIMYWSIMFLLKASRFCIIWLKQEFPFLDQNDLGLSYFVSQKKRLSYFVVRFYPWMILVIISLPKLS